MAGAQISFKGMVAGAVLLGMLMSFGSASAEAAGCAQAPGCPYLEASVFGREPATGHGVFRFPQAVALSPGGGFVFVADQLSGVVQKFDRQGNWVSQIGWFADKGQLRRFGVIGGLATDRNNHLYVLDSQYNRVQVFRSDTGAWLGAWGSKGATPGTLDLGATSGAGGLAIHQPAAVEPAAVDTPIAFIADQSNHRIQRFTLDRFSNGDPAHPVLPGGSPDPGNPDYLPAPNPDTTWGSQGDCTAHGCGQVGDRNHLNFPHGIAVNPHPDSMGRTLVHVVDAHNHRVVQFTTDGAYVNEVGGSAGGAQGQFLFPHDVAVDLGGSLYVADNGNHRVQRFNASDLSPLNSWGGLGSAQGQFELPRAIGTPADGVGVYVADSGNHRVQGFDQLGNPTVSWGLAGRGGPGYVTRPGGLAVDRTGNVYVGDTWAHRVEKLSGTGAFLDQWGNVLASGFAAPGKGNGRFHFPRSLAFDPAGNNIWIADTNNNRIQVLTATGTWLAKIGGTAAGSLLGQFSGPRALAVGPNGDLYVADTGNNRIQKRNSSGDWSLVTIGTALDAPTAVAVDGSGTLFVADRTRLLRVEGAGATQIDPPSGVFDRPAGLWVTGSRLYVSDTGNSRVLRLDRPSGSWAEIGGEGFELGAFVAPTELTTTPDERLLYVADQHNNRIQRFLLELPPGPRTAGRPSNGTQPSRGVSGDRERPRLRLRARLRQRALRRGAVLVSINCTESCLAEASGRLQVRRTGRSLPLRRTRRYLASGVRVTLYLRLSKKVRRKAARALKRGRLVTARVVVTARDSAGNTTKDARRIRIRP